MSEKNISGYSLEEIKKLRAQGRTGTDWQRLRAMRDEDIDFSDIPETDAAFWEGATDLRPGKQPVHIRLDSDVVSWFKAQGRGYQTRINAILRHYMEAHRG